jgi:isopentenyl diphosphate isomerase/L-lactate dehydrogenase-like FMN-dependent dehydrogenase
MIGRATLYGIAAAGEAGAARALEIFHEEIRRNMALLGVNAIGELGPQYLKFVDPTLRPRALSRTALRAVEDSRSVAEA